MNMDYPEIIVIEDNYHDLEMIKDALRELKINRNVCILRDGAEATKYFFNSAGGLNLNVSALPKLILLDLKLPKINGLEVLKALKTNKDTRSLPVVIFTSSDESSDRINSYHLGANSYLVKPLDADEYFSYIRDIINYWIGMNATAQ
jgi:DNA-binding response OmpR family regulator